MAHTTDGAENRAIEPYGHSDTILAADRARTRQRGYARVAYQPVTKVDFTPSDGVKNAAFGTFATGCYGAGRWNLAPSRGTSPCPIASEHPTELSRHYGF